MFSKFKELFANESLLDTAYSTTVKMLEFDLEMYSASRGVLRDSDNAKLPFDIKKADRRINKYEREVRRNVLTHLTIAGTTNLIPGMVLVTIVISVERIGDLSKNIVDLAGRHEKRLRAGRCEKDLVELEGRVGKNFEETIVVLRDQIKSLGSEVMKNETPTNRIADKIIDAMLESPDPKLTTGDSVAVALYARHLKRINSHLTTIASAIVNPFPRIGFREKHAKKS